MNAVTIKFEDFIFLLFIFFIKMCSECYEIKTPQKQHNI